MCRKRVSPARHELPPLTPALFVQAHVQYRLLRETPFEWRTILARLPPDLRREVAVSAFSRPLAPFPVWDAFESDTVLFGRVVTLLRPTHVVAGAFFYRPEDGGSDATYFLLEGAAREYVYTDDFPEDDAAAAAAVLGGASLGTGTPPGSPGSAGGRNNSTTATKRELRPGSFFEYELALGKAAHVPAGMEAVADCAAYAIRHTDIRLYHGGYDSPFGLRLRRVLLECLKSPVVATGKEKQPPKAAAPLVPFDRAIGGRPAGSEAAGLARLRRAGSTVRTQVAVAAAFKDSAGGRGASGSRHRERGPRRGALPLRASPTAGAAGGRRRDG